MVKNARCQQEIAEIVGNGKYLTMTIETQRRQY